MQFGEQLKKRRNERNLSQPALAELAGIEQSYLSKIENGKSVPSNEVFRCLLQALEISLSDFLTGFDAKRDRAHLSQIEDIAQWYRQQDAQRMVSQRQYLYVCSALVVFAVTFFYIGFSKVLFSEVSYQYYSPGVVLPGEPKNIFNNWERLIDTSKPNWSEKQRVMKAQINARLDEEFVVLVEDKGPSFEVTVDNGLRYYSERAEVTTPRIINAIFKVLGVLMFSAGLVGFLLERRLYRGH